MSFPVTKPPIPVELPILGMNRRDARSAMDPRYAEWALNWEPEPQYCRVRNGWSIHCTLQDVSMVLGLGKHQNELYAYTQGPSGNNDIYDVTSSTESLDHTTGSSTPDEAYPVNAANQLYFVTEHSWANGARYYDGSTWNNWGFTEGGGSIGGRVMTSYKGRIYIFNGQDMYYSAVGAVTGATTKVDYTSIFKEAPGVIWAGVITNSTGTAQETYLAFGNGAGEILVYGGDNPGAANWTQVGKFKISPPVFYNSALEINNDIWIPTTSGLASLKELFKAGSSSSSRFYNVSWPIDPYWTNLIREINDDIGFYNNYLSTAYWPEQNKVFILVSGSIDEDGTYDNTVHTLLCYNTITEAWTVNTLGQMSDTGLGGDVRSLTYFNNGLYLATSNVVMKYDLTKWTDEAYDSVSTRSAFSYKLHSAYQNMGSHHKFKKVRGFVPIAKTDFTGALSNELPSMKSAVDFGSQVSAAEKAKLISGYNQPFYACGNTGTYFQWRLEGEGDSASSDGYELYAMGAVVE